MSEVGHNPELTKDPNYRAEYWYSPQAGLELQVRVAQALISLIDPRKITPETLEPALAAFRAPIPPPSDKHELYQALAARDTTRRLLATVALLAARGDVAKANELLGGEPYVGPVQYHNDPDNGFDFAAAVKAIVAQK
jgi:hypothetical protein